MEKIAAQGFLIELNDEAKDFLLEKGFDAHFGARPLQRVIQRYLDDAIAEEILSNRFVHSPGDPPIKLVVSLNHETKRFELKLKEKSKVVS
jgi:ATP-dependent Clp protease ATP-binding subunit ClpC